MWQDLTDNYSTMFQVKVWCQQAITWANFDPDLCRHMASLGHNGLALHNFNYQLRLLSYYGHMWNTLIYAYIYNLLVI